jgi:DHA1 family tetracycline resistance protein-like MFS transporter
MIGAAWGVGFVMGPALGGLLGNVNPRLPFWVAAGLALLNAFYGLFVLPESLAPERRKAFAWRRANPIGSLVLLRSHPELLGLSSVTFTYFLAHQVLPSVFVLYTSFRYGWNEFTTGLILAIIGVFNIIVQGALVKRIVARFGERLSLFAGILCGGVGYAIYGLAPTGIAFLCALPIFAFMGLVGPAAQALMTRHVGSSEQGQLQGANSSVMGITGMIGPGLFALTFASFIGAHRDWRLPGAPFLLAALMMVMALVLAWRVTSRRPEIKR